MGRLKLLLCCTWKSELQGLLLLPISYHALATRNVGDMKVLTFKHYVVGQQSTVVMEGLNILKFLQGTAIATLIEKNVHGLLSPQEGWLNMRNIYHRHHQPHSLAVPNPTMASESRLYTFSQESKDHLRKFRLGTSRASDPQAVICIYDR